MSSLLRAIALAAPLAFVAPDIAQAQKTVPGWTMTVNSTIDSGDAAHRVSIAVRQQVTPRNFRTEFIQVSGSSEAGNAEGMYTILDVVDTTVTMVMPSQRMATIMNPSGLLRSMGTGLTIERRTSTENVEDLGAGERMLGHATHRYRVTTTGTMNVTMMGETCVGRLDQISDMWIAPDVDLSDALATMSKHYGSVYGLTDFPISATTTGSSVPKGTALRTISRTTRPDANGRMVTVTSTQQYVELSHGPLDASLFAPPPDFNTMDMRKIMSTLPEGMLDSAMTTGAEKGAKAGAKTLCQSVGAP